MRPEEQKSSSGRIFVFIPVEPKPPYGLIHILSAATIISFFGQKRPSGARLIRLKLWYQVNQGRQTPGLSLGQPLTPQPLIEFSGTGGAGNFPAVNNQHIGAIRLHQLKDLLIGRLQIFRGGVTRPF
jgi:hypothetical protein